MLALGVLLSLGLWCVEAQAAGRLEVLDVSERSLDDAPALAILFSQPLNAQKRYDGFVSVTNEDGAAVNGAWVLGEDKHLLYSPNVEPSKSYTVRVRRGLTGVTGETLMDPLERNIKTRPLPPSYGFASRGAVLPARLTDGLPVMIVNTPEVDIQFACHAGSSSG